MIVLPRINKFNFIILVMLSFVLVVLGYFSARPWTWGIMDEPGIVRNAQAFSQAESIDQKIRALFLSWRPSETGGRFRPLYYVYSISRFALFPSATAQHVIQLLMIIGIIMLWGLFLRKLDQDPLIISIGALCSLYFGPMTIAGINFLSIQELPVLLLISGALYLATRCRMGGGAFNAVIMLLLISLALLLKETAFCLLPAVLLAWFQPSLRRWEFVLIGVVGSFCILYPAVMIYGVRGGYSSSYQMTPAILVTNGVRIIRNLLWSYKFALPFLFFGLPLHWKHHSFDRLDAVCLAGIGAYSAVLLPWTSEVTYYHGPLGPFLGFWAARGAVSMLKLDGPWFPRFVKTLSVGLCLLMAVSIVRQMRNIYEFNAGLQAVQSYLIDNLKTERVYVNGNEASETIPQGMSLSSGHRYSKFIFAFADTFIESPAYIIVIGGQSRYASPALPPGSIKVLEKGRWQIFKTL